MPLNSLQIGEELLGPIFYRFCYQLWLHQQSYEAGDTMALFMSRGGFRLRHYYNLFLTANHLSPPCPQNDLYVSRMGVFKAGVSKKIDWVIDQLVSEYAWYDSQAALKMLLPEKIYRPWWEERAEEEKKRLTATRFTKELFLHYVEGEGGCGTRIRDYFADQHEMLRRHLGQVANHCHQLLLIDTGWSGSIIGGLLEIYPEFAMTAHYFGRYNYGGQEKPWFPQVIGVELEGHNFSPRAPISAIFLHRHLIEGICEVNWHSVEGYLQNPTTNQVLPDRGVMPEELRPPAADNPLALGIANYIAARRLAANPHQIQLLANQAAQALARIICYPSPALVTEATVTTRSADFGKEIDVPVLSRPLPFFSLIKKRRQIRHSLWPQGQIALEFPYFHRLVQYLHLLVNRRK